MFAALVTLAVIQYSFAHGRLITFPTYDDVGYFADAALRMQAFYDGGIAGLADSYWVHPTHSPYSTAMAVAGFSLFGLHDWAPYVMNALLAMAYFVVADRLLLGVGFWRRLLCFGLVASLPFVGMAVHEFRPDFAVALFTATGVLLLLDGSFLYGARKRLIYAGVWLGIAMLTKPPVFPQTLALGFAAIALATLGDVFVSRRLPTMTAVVRAWANVLIPFILIPLPHYFHDRQHILHYIHSILFGKFEQSYAYGGTRSQHLLYYLNGPGAQLMVGNMLWVLLAALVGAGLLLLLFGSRRDRARVVLLCVLLFGAWLIPTINKTKSNYFGLTFHTLLAFSVLLLVGRLLLIERWRRDHLWAAPTWGLAAVVLCCLWFFQWPERNGNVHAGWEAQRRQIVQELFNTIVTHCDFFHEDGAPLPDPAVSDQEKAHVKDPKVVFCCVGDFNPDLLKFMALQKQLHIEPLFNGESGNPADFIYDFQRADFIYCCEPGTKLIADFLPFAPFEQTLLDEVRQRSEFEQVGRWTFMKSTHSVYLFERRDWSGFSIVSGFGVLEGPLKQYEDNTVRWGLGPATVITTQADRDGPYEFYWRCKSDLTGQAVSVKLDGKFIGTQLVNIDHRIFGENRFPVYLTKGEHTFEFDYKVWETHADRPLAVLFEHFNFAHRKPLPGEKQN